MISVVLPLGEAIDIGQRLASLAVDHGETERCPLVHTRDRQDLTILRVDPGRPMTELMSRPGPGPEREWSRGEARSMAAILI